MPSETNDSVLLTSGGMMTRSATPAARSRMPILFASCSVLVEMTTQYDEGPGASAECTRGLYAAASGEAAARCTPAWLRNGPSVAHRGPDLPSPASFKAAMHGPASAPAGSPDSPA